MKFEDEDIEYLRSKKIFSEDFLNYLKEFKFECDLGPFLKEHLYSR